MKTVMNVAEAKAKLSELIDRALRGEEVWIARNGVEAVQLFAAQSAGRPLPRLGAWADLDIDLNDDPCAPEPLDALYSEQSIEDDLALVDPIPARFALMKARGEL